MSRENDDYICCLFSEKDPADALEKSSWERITTYAESNLHAPFSEDRFLVRCKACGKLLLISISEYSDFACEETEYRDIIPVKSTEEAETLSREYSGFSTPTISDRPYLHTYYDYRMHEEKVFLWLPDDE